MLPARRVIGCAACWLLPHPMTVRALPLQPRLSSFWAGGLWPYRLTYAISTTTEDQAITPDQAIQRIALLGAVEYSVIENATGRTLTSGRQTAFTGQHHLYHRCNAHQLLMRKPA